MPMFIAGLIIGAVLGVIVMSVFTVSSTADKKALMLHNDKTLNSEE